MTKFEEALLRYLVNLHHSTLKMDDAKPGTIEAIEAIEAVTAIADDVFRRAYGDDESDERGSELDEIHMTVLHELATIDPNIQMRLMFGDLIDRGEMEIAEDD